MTAAWRSSAAAQHRSRRAAAGLLAGNRLAVCMLFVAAVFSGGSAAERLADFPFGHGKSGTAELQSIVVAANGVGNFNGNGNTGNFNGNGNAGNFNGNGNAGSFNGNGNGGSFNGNANCGNGNGNGFSSNGNGNGKGKGAPPAWCQYLKDLNSRLGLPPGVIPDFD